MRMGCAALLLAAVVSLASCGMPGDRMDTNVNAAGSQVNPPGGTMSQTRGRFDSGVEGRSARNYSDDGTYYAGRTGKVT